MKTEKQIFTLSKNDLLSMLYLESENAIEKKNYKQIKKVALLTRYALSISENATVKIEGVRGNTEDRIMVNAGSLVECIVKHHRNGYTELWKEFNDEKDDIKNGFMAWEIKASLPNARNTATDERKPVILVNANGVYIITTDILENATVDSQGRFYENYDYALDGARHYKAMELKLGYLS